MSWCNQVNILISKTSEKLFAPRRFSQLWNIHRASYCLSGCSCGVALIKASFFSNSSMILWIIGNCSRSTLNLASKIITVSIFTKLLIELGKNTSYRSKPQNSPFCIINLRNQTTICHCDNIAETIQSSCLFKHLFNSYLRKKFAWH